jgi:Fe-S cluster assembly protein SufD
MSGSWLLKDRELARQAYHDSPPPGRSERLWKYTDPSLFATPDDPPSPRDSGCIIYPTVPAGYAKARVTVEDLADAAAGRPELVSRYLGRAVGADAGKHSALNLASWRDGMLVHVPRDREILDPLHLATNVGSAGLNVTRLLVVAEAGSSLTLVDAYMGGEDNDGTGSQVNAVVEIFAEDGARVKYVTVQDLGKKAVIHLTQRTVAGRDSRVDTITVSMGAAAMKADIGTVLKAEGAESESWGIIVGDGTQHFDHHTVHLHEGKATKSRFNYKAILNGSARSVYTGLIRIAPGAAGCEAYQENRNLMLSDTARADSVPELEIMNNEVQCTHGATVSQLEPEQVFYLESRGIPRQEAIRMIVSGFAEPAFARLPEGLRGHLRRHLELRLESL